MIFFSILLIHLQNTADRILLLLQTTSGVLPVFLAPAWGSFPPRTDNSFALLTFFYKESFYSNDAFSLGYSYVPYCHRVFISALKVSY